MMNMGAKNFIPMLWAADVLKERDKVLIGVKHCNTDYEGEIKRVGDQVKILSVGPVYTKDYTRNSEIDDPDIGTSAAQYLVIDQAKYCHIYFDDLDAAQTKKGFWEEQKRQMGIAMANDLDTFVFSKYTDAGKTIINNSVTTGNIFSIIAEAQEYFKTVNIPEGVTKYLEVSPAIATKIILAKIIHKTDNDKMIENGYLGNILGFDVYESNNITKNNSAYECLARTKAAISIASQLTETEAYRPQKRFGDAVKSLQVWGGKTVRPKELVRLTLTPGSETSI
jgi:hypothetical protein